MLGKYKRTTLGVVWLFLEPLALLSGYTLVFGVFLNSKWGGAGSALEFGLVLFAGLIFFNFFSEVVGTSTTIIKDNPAYVKKVVFPLESLVWSKAIAASMHFFFSLLVWCIFSLALRNFIPWTILLIPVIFAILFMATIGVAWFVAALSTFHGDAEHVVPQALMLLMFLSPVFFPIERVPPTFQSVMYLNPLTFVLTQGRKVLIAGEVPDIGALAIALFISIAVAAFGFRSFMINKRGFADAI